MIIRWPRLSKLLDRCLVRWFHCASKEDGSHHNDIGNGQRSGGHRRHPGEDSREHAAAGQEPQGADGDSEQDHPAGHGGGAGVVQDDGEELWLAEEGVGQVAGTFQAGLEVLDVAHDRHCHGHLYL